MLKKPLNKVRFPFLQAPFPENPLPFKKLNKKGVKLKDLYNKKGLSRRIQKIQQNIIKQETVGKIKSTLEKQNFATVDNVKQIHNFVKKSFLNTPKYTKNKTNTTDKSKQFLYGSAVKVAMSKHMFSLEQLKAEFYRKQTMNSKSSAFKRVLEERKKCSIAYGFLNKKQMQKLFLQAKTFSGSFDENFIKIVESRLDVALFRICFFPTIFSARQWIKDGHIFVNNSVINLPGYQLKGGDVITVAPDKTDVLKRRVSLFIAEKIKIRSFHYLVKIKPFYAIIKRFAPFQKITRLFLKKNFKNIVGKDRNKRLPEFSLLPKVFSFFSEKETQQLLPFLKIRNLFTSARPLKQRVSAFKISGIKPLNLEVCYINMVAIFLYSPQKVALPASIDLHLIAKSLQRAR